MIPKVDTLLDAMTESLQTLIRDRGIEHPRMVGIHTGGVWIARELHKRLGLEDRLGELDISFYRDDFSRIGMHPQVKPSNLPFSVDDQHIILVDDVLFTGRTIRAAMNELFDFGRPACISLAVLVERSGRELPIEAQVVGAHLSLGPQDQIKLSGPEPLELTLVHTEDEAR
jgi:pyrimidine operon attenuation protein/uracil phosphoribosyltransferase